MTPPATTGRAGPGGTVFDIGYQRYAGAREGRSRALLAVYRDGVRAALGFGRGPRALVLPWFFIGGLSLMGLIMAIIIGAAERLGGPGAGANLPSHDDYYGIASIMMFVFAAVVAPELICRDKREGTLTLYLVRPLTGTDYILSRWAAFLTVMTVAAWVPQLILLLGLAGGAPSPWAYLATNWMDLPRFLVAGFAIAAFLTSLSMLTASFTSRRAFAITTPFTMGLSREIGGTVGAWVSMFGLSNIPLHVSDMMFGEASEMTEDLPAKALGMRTLALWYLLWTFGSAAWLIARYRKVTP
jgi:ABC-type transport system involved in multi-copper enzyme maturation permease subunit